MNAPLLRLAGVSRTYGPGGGAVVHALTDVSLDVHEGEFIAIVGPSGGGKSSLLSILGLLDEPSSGEYEISGYATSRLSETARTRLRATTMAFVFQAFHLLDRRRVRDSVELGLLYMGVHRRERNDRALATLRALGISDKPGSRAAALSGGQRQRVAIARAVVTGNPVLLADEPTGNLDSESGAIVLSELKRIHSEGATVIVVTHSETVATTADRLVRLVDGKIVSDSGSAPRATPSRVRVAGERRNAWRVAGDVYRDALSSLSSRVGQTIGMICATAVAVALMIVSLGLGASASAQVSEAFDAQANREVSLVAAGTSQPPGLANSVARIGELAGVQQVAALSDNGEATVATAGASFAVTLRGMEGDLEGAASAEVTWMNSAVPYLHERQALVGRALARQLFLAPLALSPSIDIDGRAYAVVGIIENSRRYPLLAGQVIVGETDSLTLRPPGKVEVAIVTMPGAAPQVGQYAALAINPLAPESLVTNVPIDPQSLRQEVEGGVQTALIAFTILAGIAAVITLANVITLSVVARTGEFGLRRAVGARPSDLALLVSSEAALVGLGGGILGLLLGITGLLVFTISQRWLPVLDVRLVPLAVVVGLILAVMSSALGALRAARIAPADALRA